MTLNGGSDAHVEVTGKWVNHIGEHDIKWRVRPTSSHGRKVGQHYR